MFDFFAFPSSASHPIVIVSAESKARNSEDCKVPGEGSESGGSKQNSPLYLI